MPTDFTVGSLHVKRTYVYVAGAGIVLVLGYRYYKNKSTATATTAPTDNTIDPVTGVPYAQEQAYSDVGTPYGSLGGGYYTTSATTSTPTYSDNSTWASTASGLDLGGTPSSTISAAISKVLGGVPVSQTESDIWHEIVGILGAPPVGTYSPKLTTTATSTVQARSWVSFTVQHDGENIQQIQTAAIVASGTSNPTLISTRVAQAAVKSKRSPTAVLKRGTVITIEAPAGFAYS